VVLPLGIGVALFVLSSDTPPIHGEDCLT
jgi:hypothetical protein